MIIFIKITEYSDCPEPSYHNCGKRRVYEVAHFTPDRWHNRIQIIQLRLIRLGGSNMILGGNQPYFFPYLGYWQLIKAVDIFIISDDYQYIEGGWINRNRILQNGKPMFYNIEIEHASSNKKINELYISEKFCPQKKLLQLEYAYRKAPYFGEGYKLVKSLITNQEHNLAMFLEKIIIGICEYLEIKTKLIRSSDIPHDCHLKREQRIYEQCRYVGADTYINAIGGVKLYSFEQFRKQNISLGFLKMLDIPYKQFWYDYVPNLSIIDIIMFNSLEEIKSMLGEYDLVWDNLQ